MSGNNNNCWIFLTAVTVALLLLSSTRNHFANSLSVTGEVLCCSSSTAEAGSCPAGTTPAASGVTVNIVCSDRLLGPNATIAEGTTDANGDFDISIPPGVPTAVVRSLTVNCSAVVPLPLPTSSCPPPLSQITGGFLVSALEVVKKQGVVATGFVLVNN